MLHGVIPHCEHSAVVAHW